MSEWFREAFRAHYLSLYAHRDEQEALQTVALLAGVLSLRPGMRVLDAPSGGGRHARAFARLGCRVTGLDLSADLLARARAAEEEPDKLRRRGLELPPAEYVRGDLRGLPLASGTYDLVANLFSSFGYFATDEENAGVLNELVRVCRPGGHVVLDFFNAERVRSELQAETSRETADGWQVREWREIAGTPPRVEKRVRIESSEGEVQELCESVRLYSPGELELLMRRAGVPPLRRFGDYEGRAYSSTSPRVILVGQRSR